MPTSNTLSAGAIGAVWLAALSLVCIGTACQSSGAADVAAAASSSDAPVEPPQVESPWNRPMPSGVHKPIPAPGWGFAMTEQGALAVFDLDSGEILGEHPLGNDVYDLAWLPKACRLVARVSSNGRAQRLFAFRPHVEAGALQLSLESATEEYWGDPRILGVRSYVSPTEQRRPETLWLVHGDPVPEWQRLGSELEVLSPGVAWPQPTDWQELPRGNVVGIVGRAESAEVVFATLDGSNEHLSRFPLPGAAALATWGADLWVWQDTRGASGPTLLRFAATEPLGAPNLTQPYWGAAHVRALSATAHGVLALLEGSTGTLSLWSVNHGAARSVRVDTPTPPGEHVLALQTYAAWLGTESGVMRFALPRLERAAGFDGPKLRPPLLVPNGKTLGCVEEN